jgi:nucleoside-diphosphate-sugar epimerase
MDVLIIGGTRFLGAAVAHELTARGATVTVLHRGQTKADRLPESAEHILGDARDRGFVEDALGAKRYDVVVDTILGAEDLEWYLPFLQQRAGMLVHCGSTGVYAPIETVPAREGDPTPCPPEFGGFDAKRLQDEAVQDFHARTGFTVCSMRISNVYGAGDVPLDIWGAREAAYFQRLADGEEIWIPENGMALLQPVHVEDLARGFAAAIEAGEKVGGQIYNLSSDRAVTLTEYARLAADVLNSSSPMRCVPLEEILATGKANEGGLRFICEHMAIDSSKAREALGYAPQFDVREGLRDALGWMVRAGMLKSSSTRL